MQPAIDDRLVGVRVTAVVAVDHRDGTHKNLAAVVNPNLNPGHRRSNRVKLDMTFSLRGGQRAGFSLTIELLQLHPERSEEQKRILADRLAAGKSSFGPRKTEEVPDRPINEQVSDRVHQPLDHSGFSASKSLALQRDGPWHEDVEQAALQRCRVGHADLNPGQHAVPRPRRCEVERRRHLAQIV